MTAITIIGLLFGAFAVWALIDQAIADKFAAEREHITEMLAEQRLRDSVPARYTSTGQPYPRDHA